jgi:hypothetical protein
MAPPDPKDPKDPSANETRRVLSNSVPAPSKTFSKCFVSTAMKIIDAANTRAKERIIL